MGHACQGSTSTVSSSYAPPRFCTATTSGQLEVLEGTEAFVFSTIIIIIIWSFCHSSIRPSAWVPHGFTASLVSGAGLVTAGLWASWAELCQIAVGAVHRPFRVGCRTSTGPSQARRTRRIRDKQMCFYWDESHGSASTSCVGNICTTVCTMEPCKGSLHDEAGDGAAVKRTGRLRDE